MVEKKLRVIGYSWHTPHQYSLAKLPFISEYHLLTEPWKNGLVERQRPLNSKFKYVAKYTPGYYDFAILHIDQQCVVGLGDDHRIGKGRSYEEANAIIKDIPKIVINHMTPFDDKYDTSYVVEWCRRIIGDNVMIVNSHVAAQQWGFGRTITHGMEVNEWWDLPKEPRCVVVLGAKGMNKAYQRGFAYKVKEILDDQNVPFEWVGVTRKSFNSFDEYRDFVGRSLVSLMPTWQSPMPRARTELMLSGSCMVTTPYHDADTFIEHGVNGFLTNKGKLFTGAKMMDDPVSTAALIKRLVIDEPELAVKIGKEGKKTARKLFNREVFTEQWRKLLEDLKIL